ncbi:MAG: histidine phosphatase family protein [Alphaproteobacteria bacterium]|nr:histidine phosphatase family protein [Alphaproteobacteria bacterium]
MTNTTRPPIPPLPFWFLRHGQTDWNVARRIQGHTDIPLNATGTAQAQAAAQVLRQVGIQRIIASPLQRAAVTAAIVQEHVGVPLHHDERLKERAFGAFEGQFRHEILARHNRGPEDSYQDILPPDCESTPALHARIASVLAEQLTAHTPHTVLFVGHGAFMAHLCELLGLNGQQRFQNALPYRFTPLATGWHLEALNIIP